MYRYYLPTVSLTDDLLEGLSTGTIYLRPGQWVKLNGNVKARYVGTRTTGTNHFCYRKGDGMIWWSKRMGRARWHLAYKHNPETLFRITPSLPARDVVAAAEYYHFTVSKKPSNLKGKIAQAIKVLAS